MDKLDVQAWCSVCECFVKTTIKLGGTRQRPSEKRMIFTWVCFKCGEKDIGEIPEKEWIAIKEKKLTHIKPD